MSKDNRFASVSNEIGTLKRLLVHSPDSGLGKVVPSKAQDWLFEDIVHLDTIRRKEYDFYTKILLWFLDPEKIRGRQQQIDAAGQQRSFYKPGHPDFYKSDKVIELQWLLEEILEQADIRMKLVASVCAVENCSFAIQETLMNLSAVSLARLFISGTNDEKEMLFAPIPNFIFTRDIGITINQFLLLNKPAKKARTREALLVKYIVNYHPLFRDLAKNIIELPDVAQYFLLPKEGDDRKVTLEGGDVMVVTKDHVLIGISERTSSEAAQLAIHELFARNVVKKITVVKIPKKRDYMHIDTVFTQVKRNTWVMLGNFSKKAVRKEDADPVQRILEGKKDDNKIRITQFRKKDLENPVSFDSLEELLTDISKTDMGVEGRVKFIYSGNNEFPFDAREQWTDSCNVLALKEGVVLGYDRNDKTAAAFAAAGFEVIACSDLLNELENGSRHTDQISNCLILMPSAELSRARGGFHCMSMPLLRDDL